ncbi:Chitin binding domain, partial [Trinorchestia longiramus]
SGQGSECPPDCSTGGYLYPDPKDCTKYYECANNIPYHMSCPNGLYFSPSDSRCEYPALAGCTADPTLDCSAAQTTIDQAVQTTTTSIAQTTGAPDFQTTAPAAVSTTQVCKPPCPWAYAYMPHPQDCTKFYICDDQKNAYETSCQPGLVYSIRRVRCEYPELANCTAGLHNACD